MDINKAFITHSLSEVQLSHVNHLKLNALKFAQEIERYVPMGANRILSFRHLEDCLMRAVKGISEGE